MRNLFIFIPIILPLVFAVPAVGAESDIEGEFLSSVRQWTYAGNRSGEGYFRLDGKWMVFQSERESGNPFYQIYLQNLESGEINRISPGEGKTTCAWVHPIEKRVIYASTHLDKEAANKQKAEFKERSSGQQRKYSWDFDENYDLFTSGFDGKRTRQLTQAKGYDAEAAYSPDGKWIVFGSNRTAYSDGLTSEQKEIFKRDPSYFMEIYKMKADGSEVTRLTNHDGYDGGPFYSYDGSMITWRRFSADGHRAEVFVMRADGSEQKQVTRLKKMSWAPYFHPSGDYLIFSSNAAGGYNFELYIVDVKGRKDPVRVTNFKGFDGLPVFSPDGRSLAWTSNRAQGGKSQIFMAEWNDRAARKALGLTVNGPLARQFAPSVNVNDLQNHVAYLASPALEGRLTGSPGEQAAVEYIVGNLKNWGFEPLEGSDSYLHEFGFTSGIELGTRNNIKLKWGSKTLSSELNKDWRPLSFSESGEISGKEIVFAGYGIKAPATNEFDGYDSFADLDLKDKWVMVFRFSPEKLDSNHRDYLNRFANLHHKAMMVRDLGAKGLIVVSGPTSKVSNQLVPIGKDIITSALSLPMISISDKLAAKILGSKKRLKSYQGTLDKGKIESIQISDVNLKGFIDLQRKKAKGTNVLARLKAGGWGWGGNQSLILGAHLDHLGLGGSGNSLARGKEKGQYHPGADDNASGVAALMEIAHHLSDLKSRGDLKLNKDVVFAFWSGEELGVLGSSAFVDNFVKPEKSELDVYSYINMDMVGRSKNNQVMVQGLGSSDVWKGLIEEIRVGHQLDLIPQEDPYLPTDSTPFYVSKVPVLSFFTGAHSEYHTPRDRADRLNFSGLEKVTHLVKDLAVKLAQGDQALPYNQMKTSRPKGQRGRIRIYLGTIPDYSKMDLKGVLLSGVQEGGPAQSAGLKAGDVIIELAGHKVESIYDYTSALSHLRVGQKTKVKVVRKDKDLTLTLVPKSRD